MKEIREKLVYSITKGKLTREQHFVPVLWESWPKKVEVLVHSFNRNLKINI